MEKHTLISTVTAAQNGNEAALSALFDAYYNDVYYFALKTLKDSDLACDITQDTFIVAIQNISELREPAAFVSWLKQIAFSQCTRHFRKRKELLVDEDEDGNTIFDQIAEDRTEFIPDQKLDQDDFRDTIMGIIDQLSEEQRSATLLYYYDSMPVLEIAQIQGVSEGTVKSRLNYARKAIKASVEDYEKRNDIKLHSTAILPLLLWLFGISRRNMPAAMVQKVAQGASCATGISLTASGVSSAAAAGTAATGAAAAGLGAKIIAGVVAAAVAIGGIGIGFHHFSDRSGRDRSNTTAAASEPQDMLQQSGGILPSGCRYERYDGTVCRAGEPMPEAEAGDILVTADYTYTLEKTMLTIPMGWEVRVNDDSSEHYEPLLSHINGYPVISLNDTFSFCKNMTQAPRIPETIVKMRGTFYGCESLKTAPVIPAGVTDLFQTFSSCVSLVEAPVIPEGVTDMHGTFSDCTALLEPPVIPSTVVNMTSTFGGCSALRTAPVLPDGLLYMSHCFGYCEALQYPPVLPQGVEDISYAFFCCKNLLEKPHIPDSVTQDSHTFQFCSSLRED